MTLPRVLIQILLLPILALLLPLLYAIAWLREAIGDLAWRRLALRRVPVMVSSRRRRRDD